MDIIMPVTDGFEATRLIRQNPKTSSIPILAVTALDDPIYEEECLESGCNDHIAKPFTATQLASRIEELLKQGSTQP
jgi:CheY-like chemotaxis protein